MTTALSGQQMTLPVSVGVCSCSSFGHSAGAPPSPGNSRSPVIRSLDHLIGAGKQHLRDHDAESLRCPEIDHEFEFRRCLHWKTRRLSTANDATDIFRGT